MATTRFYKEALPLLASYFSGLDVLISDIDTALRSGDDEEYAIFESQLVARHLISSALKLSEILTKIEERYSKITTIARSQSKGSIRGRLDISLYVSQKFQEKRFPKTYPIIINTDSPQTPENLLAKIILEKVEKHLQRLVIPTKSAEFLLASKYRRYLKSHNSKPPWSDIQAINNTHRLSIETKRRVMRRQTGNDKNYNDLLEVLESLQIDFTDMTTALSDNPIVDLSLSFPESPNFADRIFEVWCLKKVGDSLKAIGLIESGKPRPLFDRKKYPIYTFQHDDDKIEVWFQKQLSSDISSWSYDEKGNRLRGIPDITIKSSKGYSLIVDAKNKIVASNTRSEETYKLLGYFENFRNTLHRNENWGLLMFTTNSVFNQKLTSNDGKRILLIGANLTKKSDCFLESDLTRYLSEWLGAISK